MSFLKLIRYKDLIFIAALLYAVQYFVVGAWLQVYNVPLITSPFLFVLLVFSALCIAGAGFAVNDYFDTRIDELNRPDKVIVGKEISRERTMLIVQILSAFGIAGGLAVAYLLGNMTIAFIFIMIPGLLWFHASSYKRQFLLGNVLAAFVAALVPIVVVLFNHQLLLTQFGELIYSSTLISTLYAWVCAFSLYFAGMTFLETFAKDMWNEYGNRELESRTLPVVWGQKRAKIVFVICALGFVAVAAHIWYHYYFKDSYFESTSLITRYLLFVVLLPFVFLIYLALRIKKPGDCELLVIFCRFLMIVGLIFTLILYFVLSKEYGITLFNSFILQ